MTERTRPVSEQDIMALVDGELDPARAAEVEAWLADHPDEARQAEGWRRGQAEGQVRGQAIMLVHLIDGRGLRATEPQRARMLSCTDERLLQHWFDRAITASSVDEILAP